MDAYQFPGTGPQSPKRWSKPENWNSVVARPEWQSATPEARLNVLATHARMAMGYAIQEGMPEEDARARAAKFYDQWRMNAIDNGVSPFEHTPSELVTSITDFAFGRVAGAGVQYNAILGDGPAQRFAGTVDPKDAEEWTRKYWATPKEKREEFAEALRFGRSVELFEDADEDGNPVLYFSPVEEEGTGGDLLKGIAANLGSALQSVGGDAKAKSRARVEEVLRKNPRLAEQFVTGDLPRGVGAAFGFVSTGFTGGPIAVSAAGSQIGAEAAYFSAKQANAGEGVERGQIAAQSAIGSLEAFGLGGAKILKATPFGKMVETGVTRYLFGGAKETAQELASQLLVDTVEKYGGIDPNRQLINPDTMLRTAGVAFITGSTMTGLEYSDKVVLLKAQKAANSISLQTAQSVLDGSHRAIIQAQRVANNPEATEGDRATAENLIAGWQSNARELLNAVTVNESQLEEIARVEGIVQPEQAEDANPAQALLGPDQLVALRDAAPEAFAQEWKAIPVAERKQIREALGVSPKAKVAEVQAAIVKQAEGIDVEPDLATMATGELVDYWGKLDAERGETPSRIRIVQTEEELQAEIDAAGQQVTPEAMTAAAAVADSLTISDESVIADPDIALPAESEFGESFAVLGANWTEYKDGVRQSAIAVVAGEKSPLFLAREKSQAWFKSAIAQDAGILEQLRAERASYEQFDSDAQSKAPDTDEGLIEWASDLAVDYLTGKATQSQTLPEQVKRFFAALARWFDSVMKRSVRLQRAIEAGAISPAFESQLAQATGLQRGAEFNPTEGLTNEEAVQFAAIRGKTEDEANEYLRQNPDVSDAVILAYYEDARRTQAAVESAGRVKLPGVAVGVTLSVARRRPPQTRMTRESLRTAITDLERIIGEVVPRFGKKKVVKLTLREAQDIKSGGQMGSRAIARLKLNPQQRAEVVRRYDSELAKVRQERNRRAAKTLARSKDDVIAQRVEGFGDSVSQSRKRKTGVQSQSAAIEARANQVFANDALTVAIKGLGGIRQKRRKDGGEFDGMVNLPKAQAKEIFARSGEGETIDNVAQSLFNSGQIREAHVDLVWTAIQRASESATREASAMLRQERDFDFQEAAVRGNELVKVNDLQVGDSMTIAGETVEVSDISPDGEVELSSEKWGVQIIPEGSNLYVDAAPARIRVETPQSEDLLSSATGRRVLEIDVNATENATLAERVSLINHTRDLEAIISALPKELRYAITGFSPLVGGSVNARAQLLISRATKAQGIVERHAQNVLLNQVDRILALGKVKLNNKGQPTGPGADVAAQISDIQAAMKMTPDDAAAEIQKLDKQIAEAEDAAEITRLSERILNVAQFSDLANRDATSLFGIVETLRELVDTGRSQRRTLVEQQRAENEADRLRAIDTMTGGRGLLNSADAKRENAKLGGTLESLDAFLKAHLGWEWMMNFASRKDRTTGSHKSFLSRYFGRMVREAEDGERRFARKKNDALMREQARLLGVDTSKKNWRFKMHQKTLANYQEQDETRVFVREPQDHHRVTRDIPISSAVELHRGRIPTDENGERLGVNRNQRQAILAALRVYQEEVAATAENLAREQVEFAQLETANVDPDVIKAARDRIKRLERDLRGLRNRTKLKGVDLTDWDAVPEVEQRLSQDQAMKITLVARQQDQQENLAYWGWTPEVIEQVEAFLTPENRQLRDWLSERYAEGYDEINKPYQKVYGAPLPRIRNYSPAPKVVSGSMADSRLGKAEGVGGNVSPSFAITRVKNKNKPDFSMGAVAEYQAHVAQMAHFIHWVEPVRKLRSVFGHKDAQEALRQTGGRALNAIVQNKIQEFADGGVRGADLHPIIDKIRRALVLAGLSFNIGQVPKQLTGIPAYMFDVPVGEFFKYQGEFWASMGGGAIKGQTADVLRKMRNLPFVRERWEEGYDRDTSAILAGAFDRKPGGELEAKSPIEQAIEDGMIFSRSGDIMTVIVGGYSAYRYAYESYLKEARQRGEDVESDFVKAAAEKEGETFMAEVTGRTQTGSGLKDLTSLEAGGSFQRIMTVFMSNSRNYFLSTWMTLPDAVSNRPGARRDFVRRVIVGHVVLPALFQMVVDALRAPFMDDEEREEYLSWEEGIRRYGVSMALGPLAGITLFGPGIDAGLKRLLGMKSFESANAVSNGISDLIDSPSKYAKELEDGINHEDILKTAEEIAASYGKLMGGPTLIVPIAERGLKSFSLDDDLDRALFETPSERDGRLVDERWDGLKRELKGMDDKKRKATVAGWRKSGRVTSDEAKLLERAPRAKGKESPWRKKFGDLGVASGAMAAAMRRELQGLPRAAQEDLLQEWEEAKLLSDTVRRQLGSR